MLLSPRKNGLTSLFKEVRVFKESNKSGVVPANDTFFVLFPGNEAHKRFLGAQHSAFWVGVKKFTLKVFICFFLSLNYLGLFLDLDKHTLKQA